MFTVSCDSSQSLSASTGCNPQWGCSRGSCSRKHTQGLEKQKKAEDKASLFTRNAIKTAANDSASPATPLNMLLYLTVFDRELTATRGRIIQIFRIKTPPEQCDGFH